MKLGMPSWKPKRVSKMAAKFDQQSINYLAEKSAMKTCLRGGGGGSDQGGGGSDHLGVGAPMGGWGLRPGGWGALTTTPKHPPNTPIWPQKMCRSVQYHFLCDFIKLRYVTLCYVRCFCQDFVQKW